MRLREREREVNARVLDRFFGCRQAVEHSCEEAREKTREGEMKSAGEMVEEREKGREGGTDGLTEKDGGGADGEGLRLCNQKCELLCKEGSASPQSVGAEAVG
eukprot:1525062-Pleurochrysis_carterae.AAC.2